MSSVPEQLFDFVDFEGRPKRDVRCLGLSASDPSKVTLSGGWFLNDQFYYDGTLLDRQDVENGVKSTRAKMFVLRGQLPSGAKVGFFVKEIKSDWAEEVKKEKEAMKLLNAVNKERPHCNLLRGPAQKSKIVRDFVIMEEMDGDLHRLWPLHPRVVGNIVQDLAHRLACLWENRLVYTDIKPENVAYKCKNGKFYVSLIDLGDIFKLPSGGKESSWVATYPFYEDEYLRGGSFSDKIKPITDSNAEFHMLWGLSVFAMLMLDPWGYDVFTHAREFTEDEFLVKRQYLANKTRGASWYKQLEYADKGVWDMLLEILVSPEAKSNYTLSLLANPKGDQSRKRKRLKLLKL